MLSLPQRLVNVGVIPEVAKRVGVAEKMERLEHLGVPTALAQVLRLYVNVGQGDPRPLIECGMPQQQAKVLCEYLTADLPGLAALSADDGSFLSDDDDVLMETY